MTKTAIRDSRSAERIKPRVMDYIRNADGEEIIEVKDGKTKKTILLADFEKQINEIRQKA